MYLEKEIQQRWHASIKAQACRKSRKSPDILCLGYIACCACNVQCKISDKPNLLPQLRQVSLSCTGHG